MWKVSLAEEHRSNLLNNTKNISRLLHFGKITLFCRQSNTFRGVETKKYLGYYLAVYFSETNSTFIHHIYSLQLIITFILHIYYYLHLFFHIYLQDLLFTVIFSADAMFVFPAALACQQYWILSLVLTVTWLRISETTKTTVKSDQGVGNAMLVSPLVRESTQGLWNWLHVTGSGPQSDCDSECLANYKSCPTFPLW